MNVTKWIFKRRCNVVDQCATGALAVGLFSGHWIAGSIAVICLTIVSVVGEDITEANKP